MEAYLNGGHDYHATMPTDALRALRDAMLETKALGFERLSAAQWEVVAAAVYNQPMLIKQAATYYGTGPKMGINPKYCLVPRLMPDRIARSGLSRQTPVPPPF
jgi:hypothetical protein